jgi:formylglycine-generating enzyme required for sulfatase activity
MDRHHVTNAAYRKFVDATDYVFTAENRRLITPESPIAAWNTQAFRELSARRCDDLRRNVVPRVLAGLFAMVVLGSRCRLASS